MKRTFTTDAYHGKMYVTVKRPEQLHRKGVSSIMRQASPLIGAIGVTKSMVSSSSPSFIRSGIRLALPHLPLTPPLSHPSAREKGKGKERQRQNQVKATSGMWKPDTSLHIGPTSSRSAFISFAIFFSVRASNCSNLFSK